MFNISEQVRGEIGLKFRLAQNSVCNKDIQKTANNKDTLFVSMYKKLQSSNLNQYCLLWDFKCPQIKLISIIQKPKTNHNKHNISFLVYVLYSMFALLECVCEPTFTVTNVWRIS